VHKHRNPLAHALDRLHEEISADDTDMIYAATAEEVSARRRSFILKWKLKCYARSLTVWKRPAIACSPSPDCRQTNGYRPAVVSDMV
jgi:transposase-like protein